MTSFVAGAGRPHAPLTAAWSITALVSGWVGFLLYALSERSSDRLLGAVLVGAAVLAAVAAASVLTAGGAARPWSLALSGTFVVLGVVAAVVVLTGTAAFVADALLLGLPPIVGGLATAALAWRW
jgi:hypothetical protein